MLITFLTLVDMTSGLSALLLRSGKGSMLQAANNVPPTVNLEESQFHEVMPIVHPPRIRLNVKGPHLTLFSQLLQHAQHLLGHCQVAL